MQQVFHFSYDYNFKKCVIMYVTVFILPSNSQEDQAYNFVCICVLK